MSDNPFLALFEDSTGVGTADDPAQGTDTARLPSPTVMGEEEVSHRQHLNDLLEHLFSFTVNPALPTEPNQPIKLLLDLDGQTWLDLPGLERALTDRLMMDADQDLPRGQEKSRMRYLGEAFRMARQHQPSTRMPDPVRTRLMEQDLPAVLAAVTKNISTALLLPEMYPGDLNLSKDLLSYLESQDDVFGDGMSTDQAAELLEGVAKEMAAEDATAMEKVLGEMLEGLKGQLSNFSHYSCNGLMLFSRTPILARCLAKHTFPRDGNSGRAYMDTLLGTLLSNSCIPKTELGEYEFFERPSSQPAGVMAKEEERVQASLADLHEKTHAVFKGVLLADEEAKHLMLMWIGDCLKANAGRGKLWSSEMGALMSNSFASDGFMLNLGSVLLRLCSPFTSGVRNPRLLKIDVTYSAAEAVVSEDAKLKGVHCRAVKEDTCVCTASDYEHTRVESSGQFNFITDVFFLAQKSLDLGFKVVQEKFVKLNQELNRQQHLHREAMQSNPQVAEQIQSRMERAMTRYLTLKAALLEPETLKRMMDLSTATSSLLVQLALRPVDTALPKAALTALTFPLPASDASSPPPGLFYVPEHFVENLCEHILVAKRFRPSSFEEAGGDKLGELLNFVLVFMGETRLMKNPHLRARLAECLECLLPHHSVPGETGSFAGFNREQLFLSHEHRLQIVPALLSVFVSIEETGQAVEFEYKFSYRRPMYDVIKYLWNMEDFRNKFLSLAHESEAHIDDESAPLFLRFVNLLINDAIFLLDEALGYMRQIGEQQAERPGWEQLTAQERTQNEGQYQHMGRLARYHNIMGKETIEMLHRLTSTIKAVFTHSTMVDRIAAMLNYFLKTLVGPERKNLKVDNLEEFEFRPGDIVHTICSIYTQFDVCEPFLSAVSRDGRSYSQDLFRQAERVLVKIGKTDVISGLQDVAKKIKSSAEILEADEALFSDAPEHFLDALMFILMKDPVKLPASGQIVDRQTISRHLLSDQTDPFNREPLSLDKVVPMDELKREIQNWMEEKRKNAMD